ncbi:MAG: hypothetical protein R3313_03910 [Candidatus Saccharimonadales bacterium]|nr:hypothetical protein [Candidatus Saccharimonadales bacterium]
MTERINRETRIVSLDEYEDGRNFIIPPSLLIPSTVYTLRLQGRRNQTESSYAFDYDWILSEVQTKGAYTWAFTIDGESDNSNRTIRLLDNSGYLQYGPGREPFFIAPVPVETIRLEGEAGYFVANMDWDIGLELEVAASIGELAAVGSAS